MIELCHSFLALRETRSLSTTNNFIPNSDNEPFTLHKDRVDSVLHGNDRFVVDETFRVLLIMPLLASTAKALRKSLVLVKVLYQVLRRALQRIKFYNRSEFPPARIDVVVIEISKSARANG